MANAFFVRCDCRNRRFTGGKSRFLQEADGRKGIASAADELCGSAFDVAEGFASAEARRGLSARPLHPFGAGTFGGTHVVSSRSIRLNIFIQQSSEQSFHKVLSIEGLQVVDALAYPDVPHRHFQLLPDGKRNAALRRLP